MEILQRLESPVRPDGGPKYWARNLLVAKRGELPNLIAVMREMRGIAESVTFGLTRTIGGNSDSLKVVFLISSLDQLEAWNTELVSDKLKSYRKKSQRSPFNAPLKSAPITPDRSAPERLEPVRLANIRSVLDRLALIRLVSDMPAPDKSYFGFLTHIQSAASLSMWSILISELYSVDKFQNKEATINDFCR